MNNGWETRRLGDVCDFDKTQGVYRGLPYVGLEHIESHTARFTGSLQPTQVKSSTFRFSKDHVLYGRLRPYLNKVLVPDFEGHCSTEIFPIKPSSQLLREYLLYWLLSEETVQRINATCTGTRMPRADMNEVLEFEFPVPPLAEQQRIVSILDQAFENIAVTKANAEKNLKNVRALFEAELQVVFVQRGKNWNEKRLKELSRISYGYTESASTEKIGPRFLRITDIQNSSVDWTGVPYCRIAAADLSKYVLNDGDIVFARTGATTGKSYLVKEPPKAVFASYLIRVQLNANSLLPEFLNLFFQTQIYWEYIRSGVSGSAQGGFNATKLGDLLIPFPESLREQQLIAGKLGTLLVEIERLASVYECKVAALEAFKQSLLHQAFIGKL